MKSAAVGRVCLAAGNWHGRLVAQPWLYGDDKNPLAVEWAELSLWQLALSAHEVHAVRHRAGGEWN